MRLRLAALLIGAVLVPLAVSRSQRGDVWSESARPSTPPATQSAQEDSQTVRTGEARVRPGEEIDRFEELLRKIRAESTETLRTFGQRRADGGGWHPWSDPKFPRVPNFR
jgi:hypothetical protein